MHVKYKKIGFSIPHDWPKDTIFEVYNYNTLPSKTNDTNETNATEETKNIIEKRKKDYYILKKIIIINDRGYHYINDESITYPGFTFEEFNKLTFKDGSAELKNDKNAVLEAVKNDGLTLEFASENLKEDIDVVLAAVRNNGLALNFASENLKKNIDVVSAAVQNNKLAFKFAPANLNNITKIKNAVKHNNKLH